MNWRRSFRNLMSFNIVMAYIFNFSLVFYRMIEKDSRYHLNSQSDSHQSPLQVLCITLYKYPDMDKSRRLLLVNPHVQDAAQRPFSIECLLPFLSLQGSLYKNEHDLLFSSTHFHIVIRILVLPVISSPSISNLEVYITSRHSSVCRSQKSPCRDPACRVLSKNHIHIAHQNNST